MEFPYEVEVTSEKETKELAKNLSEILEEGDVVALTGNLGTGKTFLIKEICKNFGINNASSPSFAIVNEYQGDEKIYHFDFYRIENKKELYDIGFEDYLADLNSIIFIEWADLIPGVLPNQKLNIKITLIDEEKRKFEIRREE